MVFAWWAISIYTFWNGFRSFAGRGISWGRDFRIDQLSKRIRTAEYLHENTNGLIRYLASYVTDIDIDVSITFIVMIVFMIRVVPLQPTIALITVMVNVGSSIIGRAWRIRTMLNDLNHFPSSVESLKKKLELKLQSRSTVKALR